MARKRGVGATISEIDLLGRDTEPPPLRLAKKDEKPEEQADNEEQPKAQVEGEASPVEAPDAERNGHGDEVAATVAAITEGEPLQSAPAGELAARDAAARAGGNGAAPAAETSSQPKPARRPRRKRRDSVDVGVELYLPEDLLFRARSLVRPQRTGARRSLGAAFVLQAYARAVDELVGAEIDVQGIEQGADEEMVERVKLALERALGGD